MFATTLKEQDVRRFSINEAGTSLGGPATHFNGSWGRLRASVLGPGGQLYVTTSDGNDQVIRISPATPSVHRIAGANRYATAAAASASAYPSGAADVMIATGADFPDALAGSATAGRLRMPLLLTLPTQIPAQTTAELDRLNPQRIYVLGGTAVINDAVASRLAAYTSGPLTRLAGPDRYATAEAITRTFWTKAARAYVASGAIFPDALTGGAGAGRDGIPMLLSATSFVPLSTGQQALRLSPRQLTMLGGTVALDAAVEARLKRLLATP